MELEYRLVELRKKKISPNKNQQKSSMFHVKQFLIGNEVFPKQKDIKKQPMFTCLQTKEYCYQTKRYYISVLVSLFCCRETADYFISA